ncbi:hypothetical protein GGS23DRAFT_596149 [Durotheca rogersii]|uniref:uncharacterized protein n=1 Tax=Durotheca rogersii TaxID=419775 RepID=UPI00221F09C6|nr:uncharacterized protein GGS23DRAFT_596149 [Durotheca rogersii]KAI5863643.1 hypothetical protein GGS23DRAFT_596149 [Durotheca rogersii]
MRPHTPSLDTPRVTTTAAAAPTSPPETPTTGSPKMNRKMTNGRPRRRSKGHGHNGHPSNLRPLGGTKFSYTRGPRPEEISPRSSNSSDEGSELSASPPQSPLSDMPNLQPQPVKRVAPVRIDQASFSVEELSDDCSLSSDWDHLDVLRPYAFEYAGSDRSQSKPRPPPDMDPTVMAGIENLNTFEDSDVDIDHDDEFTRQLQKRREERRIRRMKSGSLSKRTVSERGSDSDREDVLPYYEGNDTGPTTRRMRRKVGDRTSIQFAGPLPERIEELKEPNSDDEIILDDAEFFARELPYWTYMDVDSE